MKKKLLNLLLVLLLLVSIPGTLLLASDISGALYKMSIVVSNNGTLANYVSTNGVISTPNLIAGGFLNASANNCAVLDKADNDVPFMPGYSTNPWAFWVETIGADSYINYDLYTADTTGGSIAYFPDTTGMIVSDNSTIELGSDFEVVVEGWIDTTLSANASLVFKDDAFRTYISGATDITSAIHLGGLFPTVEAVNGGNDVVNQANHTVNLPAGINTGDLLIVYFASDDNVVITFPGGWTELFEDNNGVNVTLTAEYRIADGSEGASIVVATANPQMTAHTSYRITGYSGVPEVGVAITGAGLNPDPPNLAPSWGNFNTLWFALMGSANDKTVNAYPVNYTDGRNDVASDAVNGCGVGNARRELTAANENPGTFTLSAGENWVANTVAIAPAELEVTATGISSGEYTVKTYGVANEPAWATGDVLHFTGAADSNINAGAIYDAQAKLWVSLWFRLDNNFDGGSPADMYIFGKQLDVNNRLRVWFESANGTINCRLQLIGAVKFTIPSVETSWNANQWYHIIFSISSVEGARLIVDNGTAQTDVNVDAAPNGGDFVIGDFDDPGGGIGFIGEIQNVIVGIDDLTPTEETALYAGTAPGDETNYWYIDEGTGLTTYDYGTGGNDGTIDNAPTWETSTYTTGKTGRLCDFYIEVDDGVADPDRWGANLKGATVPDNANDWEFFLNDAMPYVYSNKMTVGGVLHAWHEWEYDTTFHDRSYYGLDFDGNDYVKNATGDWRSGDTAGTILVWMKTSANDDAMFGSSDEATNNRYIWLATQFGTGLAYVEQKDAGGTDRVVGDVDVTDNAWHLVTLVSSGTTYSIYTDIISNGLSVESGTNSGDWFADTADRDNFTIGAVERSAVIIYFVGIIDEVLVYNRALDLAEITEEYNGGVGRYTPYSTEGLVLQYHIEEGSGGTTADTSGNGYTGTITGATWVNGKVPRPAGSSGTNDATPSFRTASSDADVVATAVSFQPIEEAKAPPWTLDETTATWLTAGNVSGNFTTTPSPTYPGADVIEDIAAASGTPAQLPFVIIFGFITLAVSLTISSVLRQYGSRSLLVKVVVIGSIFLVCETLGIVDMWMLVFFLILALAIMAASKPGEVI